MNLELPEEALKEIESAIHSDESVVGIDAKKTHIIIIYMLQQIEKKLDSLEKRLDRITEEET